MPHGFTAIWNLPAFVSGSCVDRIAPRGVILIPNLLSASDAYVAAAAQSWKSLGKYSSNESGLPPLA